MVIASPVVAKPIHVEVKRRYRGLSSCNLGPSEEGRVKRGTTDKSIGFDPCVKRHRSAFSIMTTTTAVTTNTGGGDIDLNAKFGKTILK